MISSAESERLFAVTAENLRLIKNKITPAEQTYRDVYREFASLYCSSGTFRNKNDSETAEVCADSDSLRSILDRLSTDNYKPDSYDFALLCKAFSDIHNVKTEEYFGASRDKSEWRTMQTAYMKNSLSDKAYNAFSGLFPTASASYFPGFREVCEEVYYGRCAFAILPIYSSDEGQLRSFASLISKYELKIIHETDTETSGSTIMRFALLSKNAVLPQKHERFLSLSVVAEETGLPELIRILGVFNAGISSLNTRPLDYSIRGCFADMELDVSEADIYGLNLFLEGSHLRYETYGIYDII